MKGIILSGGSGTRLYPLTKTLSKQILPVYDKPMIYYPLSVLMLAGIREILIISTPKDTPNYQALLGDGSDLGLNLSYMVQDKPNGIAQAFILGEKFIGKDPVCLILGDNIFYGQGLSEKLTRAMQKKKGATIFAYKVAQPEKFGVVTLDKDHQPVSIVEKPAKPKSNYAITGLYFFDQQVVKIAKTLKPSLRGELEITDVLCKYLNEGNLTADVLGRGFAWLDTGTPESLLKASQFVEIIEERQGFKIACIEEIAYKKGWISAKKLKQLAQPLLASHYGEYLLTVLNEDA
jgi:glucose-1-phosphate thymidylyltransferase